MKDSCVNVLATVAITVGLIIIGYGWSWLWNRGTKDQPRKIFILSGVSMPKYIVSGSALSDGCKWIEVTNGEDGNSIVIIGHTTERK